MKKIYFLLVFIIMLGFVWNNKAKAECPPNWYFESYLANIDGCLYIIEFCYKCGVTGADPSNIKITHFRKAPPQMQPNPNTCDQQIEVSFESILGSVTQRFYQKCVFPPCEPGQTLLRLIIEYPLCRQIFNYAWEENGVRKHFTWSEPCMNELLYCQIIRECCYNQQTNEYVCPTTQVVPQGNYNSCSDQVPTLPPPGQTWEETWVTECYRGSDCVDIR